MEKKQANTSQPPTGTLRAMGVVAGSDALKNPAFRAVVTKDLIEAILTASRLGNKVGDIYDAIKSYSSDLEVEAVEAANTPKTSTGKTLVFPSCIRDTNQAAYWGLDKVADQLRTLELSGKIDECVKLVKETADKAKGAPVGGVKVKPVVAAAANQKEWIERILSTLTMTERSREVTYSLVEGGGFSTVVMIVVSGALRRVKISGASKVKVGHLARYIAAKRGDPSYAGFADEGGLTVSFLVS